MTRALKGGLDKYYTKQYLADYLSNLILEKFGDVEYIEPCAGSGAFLKVLPNIVGYDIKPECSDVIKEDVFNLKTSKGSVIVGNPPFGTNGSLALKILNHFMTQEVKAVAFILPRTFKKESMKNKVNLKYDLSYEIDLPLDSFEVDGKSVSVPCVFQIWVKCKKDRKLPKQEGSSIIEFTTKDKADIAVRRAGGKAGQILEGLNHTESSTYFIKLLHKDALLCIKLIDTKVAEDTAGVKSISKQEIIKQTNNIMRKINGS